jgi:hypothetical protein
MANFDKQWDALVEQLQDAQNALSKAQSIGLRVGLSSGYSDRLAKVAMLVSTLKRDMQKYT